MNNISEEKFLVLDAILTKDEAQQFYSSMSRKLASSFETPNLLPVEALSLQLEIEDENLKVWRERFSEIKSRSKN